MEHQLGIAFLNAAGAFENPMTAAAWWGGLQGTIDLPLPEGAKPRFDAALTTRLRELHEAAARAVASNGTSQADVAVLSAALATGAMQLRGQPPAIFFVPGDGSSAVLFPLAYAAARLLAADRRRLRTCAYDGCAAFFWDTTKNGTRRWCRLGCMERARAPRRRLQR